MNVIDISSEEESTDDELRVVEIFNNNLDKTVSDESDETDVEDDGLIYDDMVVEGLRKHNYADDQEKSGRELEKIHQPEWNFCFKDCHVKLERLSTELKSNHLITHDNCNKNRPRPKFIANSESASYENYEPYEYSELPSYLNEESPKDVRPKRYGSMNCNTARSKLSRKKSFGVEIKKEPMKERKSKRLKQRNKEIWEAIKCVFSEDEEEDHLVCSECGSTFSKMYRLTKHIKMVHLKLMPYQCSKCDESFSSHDQFYDHNLAVHKVIVLKDEKHLRQFKCPYCSSAFKDDGALLKHIRHTHGKFKPFRCVPCDLTFAGKSRFTKHNNTCHTSKTKQEKSKSVNSKNIKSESCLDSEKKTPVNHKSVDDTEQNNYESSDALFSEKSFSTDYKNHVHMTDVSSDEESVKHYKCLKCDSVFCENTVLLEHIGSVHCKAESVSYACPICDRTFSRKVVLRRHLNLAHGKFYTDNTTHSQTLLNGCNSITPSVFNDQNHITPSVPYDDNSITPSFHKGHSSISPSVFNDEYSVTPSGPNGHSSITPLLVESEERSDNDSLINYDLKMVLGLTNSHRCSKCEMSFDTDSNLSSHIRVVHNVMKQQTCAVCRKKFLNFQKFKNYICYSCKNLYSDKYITHLFEPNIKLNGGTSENKNNFNINKTKENFRLTNVNSDVISSTYKIKDCRTIISNKIKSVPSCSKRRKRKKHKCSDCGQKFRTVSALSHHSSTAHEARELQCLQCNKTFGLERQLKVHMNLAHKPDPYECSKCDLFFLQKSHLQEHRVAFHSNPSL